MNFYKNSDHILQQKSMNWKIEKLKEDKPNYLLLVLKYDTINHVVLFNTQLFKLFIFWFYSFQ